RTVTTASAAPINSTADGQNSRVSADIGMSNPSAVAGVGGAVSRDLRFVLVTDRQQLFLGHDLLAALLEMEVRNARLDDGIHRAGFLAEAAVDALEQID